MSKPRVQIAKKNELSPTKSGGYSQCRPLAVFDNVDFNQGMFMRQLSYLFSLLVLVSSAYAHGPTPQKAKESIVIHAPVTKVWAAVKDFDDISQWHPDLKQSQGDGKNQSGGGRTLVFNNDASLTEELDYYNEQEHEYSYRLKAENTKAIPTSSHSVEIKVSHGDTADSSIVSFKSRFSWRRQALKIDKIQVSATPEVGQTMLLDRDRKSVV